MSQILSISVLSSKLNSLGSQPLNLRPPHKCLTIFIAYASYREKITHTIKYDEDWRILTSNPFFIFSAIVSWIRETKFSNPLAAIGLAFGFLKPRLSEVYLSTSRVQFIGSVDQLQVTDWMVSTKYPSLPSSGPFIALRAYSNRISICRPIYIPSLFLQPFLVCFPAFKYPFWNVIQPTSIQFDFLIHQAEQRPLPRPRLLHFLLNFYCFTNFGQPIQHFPLLA